MHTQTPSTIRLPGTCLTLELKKIILDQVTILKRLSQSSGLEETKLPAKTDIHVPALYIALLF